MSEHYPDGHNVGTGFYAGYDSPEEKENSRLQSQVTRLKALCGELWEHMHPNSKDCDVCKALKQRLKKEGVIIAVKLAPRPVKTADEHAREYAQAFLKNEITAGQLLTKLEELTGW